jgi:hypothetical protein
MNSTSVERVGAGLSLLFAPGERPEAAGLQKALAACQAQGQITRSDAERGAVEIVANGLTFECDGLAPAEPCDLPRTSAASDGADRLNPRWQAVRLYPGAHLSGGLRLAPVTRALLALGAELAVRLPARAVLWHPADTAVEPDAFSRMALAWLSGGGFPAPGLATLTPLSDGSVVSRGLAHFVGQEITLRPRSGETAAQTLQLASRTVDRLVRHGRVEAITEFTVDGEVLCVEPAQRGDQLWVWRPDPVRL